MGIFERFFQKEKAQQDPLSPNPKRISPIPEYMHDSYEQAAKNFNPPGQRQPTGEELYRIDRLMTEDQQKASADRELEFFLDEQSDENPDVTLGEHGNVESDKRAMDQSRREHGDFDQAKVLSVDNIRERSQRLSRRDVRIEYHLRNILKERAVRIDEGDLDNIDWITSSGNGIDKIILLADGRRVQVMSDGRHKLAFLDDKTGQFVSGREMTDGEVEDFNRRFPLDLLLPIWAEAHARALKEDAMQGDGGDPKPLPPSFPPDAKYLDDKGATALNGADCLAYQKNCEYNQYPKIGAPGLSTRYGKINGRMVWCDGITAVFETPQGLLRMLFKDIVSPSGYTYGEISRKQEERRNEKRIPALKQRTRSR